MNNKTIRHIKFCKQNTAMLIVTVLRENELLLNWVSAVWCEELCRSRRMLSTRLKAEVNNILLSLHSSSHPTQPLSINAKYISCFFFQDMCNKQKCRKEFVKRKDLNTTKASYCNLECCFRDDCNDMTSEAIALRFALSGASSTKSIADWLSSSFVYMMVSAVWRSIAQ